MIPFFRKLRKKLADDNHFLKYSRYAIGEIVLVVVGILIALQINNWHKSNEKNELKSVYLSRLIYDIKSDTTNIAFVRSELELNQATIHALIKKINTNASLEELDTLFYNFFERGWIISEFIPTSNTYTDLSQTGNMNIFNNPDLIDEVIQYYSWMTQVENSNNVNKDWITPLDQEVAQITAAFELDPATSALFSHKDRKDALRNLSMNRELIERNAAGHYWINQSLSSNLLEMHTLCIYLLETLEKEYELTN
jgi:hypothetical protein